MARGEEGGSGNHDAAGGTDLASADVTAALAHYQQLGFDVRAYGPPGEANPGYGFVRWGEVELFSGAIF